MKQIFETSSIYLAGLCLCCFLPTCSDDPDAASGSADSDADADTDGDTDVDGDADADNDGDVDTGKTNDFSIAGTWGLWGQMAGKTNVKVAGLGQISLNIDIQALLLADIDSNGTAQMEMCEFILDGQPQGSGATKIEVDIVTDDMFIDAIRPIELNWNLDRNAVKPEDIVLLIGMKDPGTYPDLYDNPATDPMPTGPGKKEDPRVEDSDGDGRPGVKVHVDSQLSILGKVEADMFVAIRAIMGMEGSVQNQSSISGKVNWSMDLTTLDATSALFKSTPVNVVVNPNRESVYKMARFDGDSCTVLREEKQTLFSSNHD